MPKDAVAVHGPDGADRGAFVGDPVPDLPGLVQGVRARGPARRECGQAVRAAAQRLVGGNWGDGLFEGHGRICPVGAVPLSLAYAGISASRSGAFSPRTGP
ncbi:hypothetical protein GCM10010282_32350 [Streptomyces roseolus]|nr:hypothetical protein GCM10010282_32350 [Streptomyces roseolus]